MDAVIWGLLGPESVGSERRTRTLNLGATVRSFNDLAVPGMGGVWFGKQLFLATLGVAVAEQARAARRRVSNIEVANAIEALGCWLALHHNGWGRDPRVRGANKMRRVAEQDLSFDRVRKPSFYVTQPMRQATIQPLRDLGLIESAGERFNGFTCSETGEAFINAVAGHLKPSNRSVTEHLVNWVKGENVALNTPTLRQALSPMVELPALSREILRERICAGNTVDSHRRANALRWVESRRGELKAPVDWKVKPEMLDEDHWRDLHVGSLFFIARDAAILLLDQIEEIMGSSSDRRLRLSDSLPPIVSERCRTLRLAAADFLSQAADPTPNPEANKFCRECSEPSTDTDVLRNLIAREGRVLQLKGNDIVPGSAFAGKKMSDPEMFGAKMTDIGRSDEEGGTETPPPVGAHWPPGISHRIKNLFLMNIDLKGDLDSWLTGNAAAEGETL